MKLVLLFALTVITAHGSKTLADAEVDGWVEEARLLYWKAKSTVEVEAKEKLLDSALALAQQAREKSPKDPGALLSWVATKGEMALIKSKFIALSYLNELRATAEELRDLNAPFKHYAAYRVLGRLYQLAPRFFSFGDRSKAREYFEKAIEGDPKFPGNQIFFADFLFSEGEYTKASRLAKEVLKSPELEKYPLERADWEKMAKVIIQEAEGKS
jgi:tetratricopeptide (TPR) repeat protein